jgi:AmmeMemoRadiSam system protein B
MRAVRPTAVAGTFYPGRREDLVATLDALLAPARARVDPTRPAAKAYVLPHAGYVYSGSTAALGYAELEQRRGTLTRVVLLGPTHRVPVDGLALPAVDGLETPLGTVPVEPLDPAVRAALPQVLDVPEVHAQEHSLEVHLPFLQTVLGDVTVVPLAVGRARPDQVAAVLDALWGGAETVVVVSSDLSHYLRQDQARAVDEGTVAEVLGLEGPLHHSQACGATPVNGLLLTARRRGMTTRLLGMCTSGDVTGDRRRVVGYAAIALTEPAPTADGQEGG